MAGKDSAPNTPGYNHKIPPQIPTPDTVETRIGTLKFFDGLPSKETTQKVFDNLDFQRGVDVFVNFIPAASMVHRVPQLNFRLQAICDVLRTLGQKQPFVVLTMGEI